MLVIPVQNNNKPRQPATHTHTHTHIHTHTHTHKPTWPTPALLTLVTADICPRSHLFLPLHRSETDLSSAFTDNPRVEVSREGYQLMRSTVPSLPSPPFYLCPPLFLLPFTPIPTYPHTASLTKWLRRPSPERQIRVQCPLSPWGFFRGRVVPKT